MSAAHRIEADLAFNLHRLFDTITDPGYQYYAVVDLQKLSTPPSSDRLADTTLWTTVLAGIESIAGDIASLLVTPCSAEDPSREVVGLIGLGNWPLFVQWRDAWWLFTGGRVALVKDIDDAT